MRAFAKLVAVAFRGASERTKTLAKFELVEHETISVDGVRLRRLRALRNFGAVKACREDFLLISTMCVPRRTFGRCSSGCLARRSTSRMRTLPIRRQSVVMLRDLFMPTACKSVLLFRGLCLRWSPTATGPAAKARRPTEAGMPNVQEKLNSFWQSQTSHGVS